jgi:hypothetical protein
MKWLGVSADYVSGPYLARRLRGESMIVLDQTSNFADIIAR